MQDQTLFFVIITVVVIGIILFVLPRLPRDRFRLHLAVGLLLGGAVGNLWDRVYLGYVIDFFDFRIWPVFNVADMAIILGVGFFFWELLALGREN